MIEALQHLPLAPPLLLALLVLGGLGLRQWGAGRIALAGTMAIWLTFAIAVAWLAFDVVVLLQMMQG